MRPAYLRHLLSLRGRPNHLLSREINKNTAPRSSSPIQPFPSASPFTQVPNFTVGAYARPY